MEDANPLNIIMVDDDLDDIYITKRRLSTSDISANFIYEHDATRLFTALSDMRERGPGPSNIVVLLDINMPEVSGLEVLQKLRESEEYSDIPVLMLCTSDDVRDMRESYGSGADGYLIKPIVTDEMLGFITNMGANQLPFAH